MTNALFVVISGLPGSGKTTVGRALAPALDLPLLDKDEVLEELFAARGVGDAGWRRQLSRESDGILEARARAAAGAVIVSFWHVDGMAAESGTPTSWLRDLGGRVVHVRCVCPVDTAVRRFLNRLRHQGHLDDRRTAADVLRDFERLHALPPIPIDPTIEINTAAPVDVEALAREIHRGG